MLPCIRLSKHSRCAPLSCFNFGSKFERSRDTLENFHNKVKVKKMLSRLLKHSCCSDRERSARSIIRINKDSSPVNNLRTDNTTRPKTEASPPGVMKAWGVPGVKGGGEEEKREDPSIRNIHTSSQPRRLSLDPGTHRSDPLHYACGRTKEFRKADETQQERRSLE